MCPRVSENFPHITYIQTTQDRIPYLQLNTLAIKLDIFYFEINPNGGDECRRKRVIGITQQQTSFSHTTVTNHQQLDLHIILSFSSCHIPIVSIEQTDKLKVTSCWEGKLIGYSLLHCHSFHCV